MYNLKPYQAMFHIPFNQTLSHPCAETWLTHKSMMGNSYMYVFHSWEEDSRSRYLCFRQDRRAWSLILQVFAKEKANWESSLSFPTLAWHWKSCWRWRWRKWGEQEVLKLSLRTWTLTWGQHVMGTASFPPSLGACSGRWVPCLSFTSTYPTHVRW